LAARSGGLDGNTKAKIHHYIGQIRSAIETAGLPVEKRDALHGKLNLFAEEVDKTRTDLQAGMAFIVAFCDGIGQGFEKLEPARRGSTQLQLCWVGLRTWRTV